MNSLFIACKNPASKTNRNFVKQSQLTARKPYPTSKIVDLMTTKLLWGLSIACIKIHTVRKLVNFTHNHRMIFSFLFSEILTAENICKTTTCYERYYTASNDATDDRIEFLENHIKIDMINKSEILMVFSFLHCWI